MAALIGCRLHQVLGSANRRFGIGMGCCQLDGDYTVCNGDVEFCEKPDLLIQHVIKNFERSIMTKTRLHKDRTFVPSKSSL